MALAKQEDLKTLAFVCPKCKWKGKGPEAVARQNDVVRCPQCGAAVERDGSAERGVLRRERG